MEFHDFFNTLLRHTQPMMDLATTKGARFHRLDALVTGAACRAHAESVLEFWYLKNNFVARAFLAPSVFGSKRLSVHPRIQHHKR